MSDSRQPVLTQRSPVYWRVTFDHPPLDIFGPETLPVDVETRLGHHVGLPGGSDYSAGG